MLRTAAPLPLLSQLHRHAPRPRVIVASAATPPVRRSRLRRYPPHFPMPPRRRGPFPSSRSRHGTPYPGRSDARGRPYSTTGLGGGLRERLGARRHTHDGAKAEEARALEQDPTRQVDVAHTDVEIVDSPRGSAAVRDDGFRAAIVSVLSTDA